MLRFPLTKNSCVRIGLRKDSIYGSQCIRRWLSGDLNTAVKGRGKSRKLFRELMNEVSRGGNGKSGMHGMMQKPGEDSSSGSVKTRKAPRFVEGLHARGGSIPKLKREAKQSRKENLTDQSTGEDEDSS